MGEFTDIQLLVDWARQTGLKMVQILPINDTTATHTWVDSYPYAAISVFALHPLYLNLDSGIQQTWLKDVPGAIKKAEANWPGIKDKLPSEIN